MANWTLHWNFDAPSYQPGQTASVTVWLENCGTTPLYLGNLRFNFDFGTYELATIAGQVAPGKKAWLGTVRLNLPGGIVGTKVFTLDCRIYEFVGAYWADLGWYRMPGQGFINVYPLPQYRVFVSRGIRVEDRVIGDPIAEAIREWGLATVTVGIEAEAADGNIPAAVREQIKLSDAVIAIATPRFLDGLSGLWRTLEWAHGELGIGFGVDKPLLILRDRRVSLGGLPSYLESSGQVPIIEFAPHNPDSLKAVMPTFMPQFRSLVGSNKMREGLIGLGKLGVGGLAVVGLATLMGGRSGSLDGSSPR